MHCAECGFELWRCSCPSPKWKTQEPLRAIPPPSSFGQEVFEQYARSLNLERVG